MPPRSQKGDEKPLVAAFPGRARDGAGSAQEKEGEETSWRPQAGGRLPGYVLETCAGTFLSLEPRWEEGEGPPAPPSRFCYVDAIYK